MYSYVCVCLCGEGFVVRCVFSEKRHYCFNSFLRMVQSSIKNS